MGKRHQYRKRPVTIEAFQTVEGCWEPGVKRPKWLDEAMDMAPGTQGSVYAEDIEKGQIHVRGAIALAESPDEYKVFIGTREGAAYCPQGYWIIRGVHGELYGCDPAIFAETYEKA